MNVKCNNREQYKRMLVFFLSLINLGILTVLFGTVWYLYYAQSIVQPFFRKGNWLIIAIYALLMFIFTKIYGGYRYGYLKRGQVIYSATLSTLFVNLVTYLQISLIGRDFLPLVPILVMTVCDFAVIIVWSSAVSRFYNRMFPAYRMLIIYGSRSAESLINKMNTRPEKYNICEAINISEGLDYIYERIHLYESVIICDVKSGVRNRIIKYCFEHAVRTYITPKISDILLRGADEITLFDTPLLLCRNFGLSFEQRVMKRTLDLVLATAGLVALSPLLLLVSLLIRLHDGGPILYRQQRMTLEGRLFEVVKFRTMVVDAEKDTGACLASENDNRVTPIGRVIRKIRFDEFPQLLNILRGEMSLVGPRPERPEIAQQYEQEIPEFGYRLKVKAGLTGYAQVIGRYNTTPYDKLKLDLAYIENYSLFLDLKLILMTIKILFVPESTAGLKRGAKTAMQPKHEPSAEQEREKINK